MMNKKELRAGIKECMKLGLDINMNFANYLYNQSGADLYIVLRSIVDLNSRLEEIYNNLK